MARVLGEAHLDPATKKYYYEITTDTGQVLQRAAPVFPTKVEAEAELIELLQGLQKKAHP